ncbi:MAG: hypothetical protein R3F19_15040 [Verrucomicrobiales bacterium]
MPLPGAHTRPCALRPSELPLHSGEHRSPRDRPGRFHPARKSPSSERPVPGKSADPLDSVSTILMPGGFSCFDGCDLREWRLADVRRQVGLAFQESLFRASVAANIAFGNPEAT